MALVSVRAGPGTAILSDELARRRGNGFVTSLDAA
jgi:hypothetical protein